ncbi:MAG: HAD hydrolase-like protein [Bacteroidota bacterium]
MKLIVFDIDGTVVDSVKADDECFIKTFSDLHQIDLGNANWNDFNNVTDSGLTDEIFQKHKNRKPTEAEVATIKSHFKDLLFSRKREFSEIPYAVSFIETIAQNPEFVIAFATGGWQATARLKCAAAGFELSEYLHKTSDDHYNRGEIIRLAIKSAFEIHHVKQFESVIYFGDGLWDFKTCKELDIDMIGVDFHHNRKLKDAGLEKIIRDYSDYDQIIQWIEGLNIGMKDVI